MDERLHLYVYFSIFGAGYDDECPGDGGLLAADSQMADHEAVTAARNFAAIVERWVADTGCGHDLIPRSVAAKHGLPLMSAPGDGLSFTTANGRTEAAEVTDVEVQELDEVASPYILEATPPVLSVGARCMLHEFTFIWLAGECPFSSFLTGTGFT